MTALAARRDRNRAVLTPQPARPRRAALGRPVDTEPDIDGYAVSILLELLDPESGAGGVASPRW